MQRFSSRICRKEEYLERKEEEDGIFILTLRDRNRASDEVLISKS